MAHRSLLIQGNPEQVATLIRDGIAKTLEENIKSRLMEIVDPIVSELARDLAKKTSVHVESYMMTDPLNFSPKIVVNLAFNNQLVKYHEAAGTGERSPIGRTIGSLDEGSTSSSPSQS